ncbi:4-hydroxy-tetrahydrodipicolinate reductase [Lachnospiraceae bacterium 29-84]
MVRMIMHGCNGKMGRVISSLCEEDTGIEIVAGVDPYAGKENPYPVFPDIRECTIDADVVVDFAAAPAVDGLLEYCAEHKLPVVLCTTGLNEAQLLKVEEAARRTAVLKSANMSLGVNMLLDLLQKAARVLAPAGFDMEIVEKHHNQKVDAPSGTALALADAIQDSLDPEYLYKYDRSQERKKRETYEIGIQSVRGGSIVGEHEVIFAGADEVVELKHTAYSKAIFAKGAIEAAKYLSGKPAGKYEMRDVIAGA